MESQPQNPEFRNNPEKFYPCKHFFFSNKMLTISKCLSESVKNCLFEFLFKSPSQHFFSHVETCLPRLNQY